MGGGVVVIMCGGKMWNLFTFFFHKRRVGLSLFIIILFIIIVEVVQIAANRGRGKSY